MQSSFQTPLMAGALAGLSVDLILFPLDTLKTRLQSSLSPRPALFSRLYSGLGPVMLGSAPSAAVFFLQYSFLKSEGYSVAVAAAGAELSGALLRLPLDSVKSHLQVSAGASVSSVVKNLGLGGLYAGFWITILRELPFCSLQMSTYEYLKRQQDSPQSAMYLAGCSLISGSLAAASTTPLDVIRTRTLLREGSVSHVTRRIYNQEGVSGFFKGVAPRTAWCGIGAIIFLGVYEQALRILS